MRCHSCGAGLPANAKFCAACGEPISESDVETVLGQSAESGQTLSLDAPSPMGASPRAQRPTKSGSQSSAVHNSDALGGARFAPGQIIAGRYRVVALAGRGGMGEVYRAEDLKLGQVVAIKFLPESLSNDAAALARFHSEVRIARQVSHANVCRVFDIGDVDGIAFLTMEYVDGEDLASVVRRIGRLSPDKAIEITRQMCAGLAAAHDRGVIHRDLKPANVMLDSAGKIRITDFGLAGLAANIQSAEIRAGTPAYMAPEQLAGLEVTSRSDVYSLGLIFYELITGKRAFDSKTLAELMEVRQSGRITTPSTLVRDLDPVIERVILRCLEGDPQKRPASALQVAASLPGGDPLAAALAAGETPSPEMVAAAGTNEGLRPRFAVALLAIVSVGLVVYMFISDRTKLNNVSPLENPPEVLLAKSREIIRQLGYTVPPLDFTYGFVSRDGYLDYIEEHDKSNSRWAVLAGTRPASTLFWYRQSPRELFPAKFFTSEGAGIVTEDDPPPGVSGMIYLILDPEGHLLHFDSISPQKTATDSTATAPAPDWAPLFAAAGLTPADYQETAPQWTPLYFVDARAAWTGILPDKLKTTERIEAAAYHGKLAYFDVVYPWDRPTRDPAYAGGGRSKVIGLVLLSLFTSVVVGSIYVARQSVKQNRADVRSASRLAAFVQIIFLARWALRAHHLEWPTEFEAIILALAWSFLIYSLARVLYLALEPFVRRRDPHTLISWSRLMAGQWRDPLVGRDVLIGATYGVLLGIWESSDNFLLPLLGKLPPQPNTSAYGSLLGVRHAIGLVLNYTWIFVLYSLMIFFLLFMIRTLVRKDSIAASIIVFLGAITNWGGEYPLVTVLASAVIWLSIYLILRRFGVLTLVVGLVVQNVLVVFPMTTHLSRWYANSALTGLFAILALSIYGFYISLAGQAVFSDQLFEK